MSGPHPSDRWDEEGYWYGTRSMRGYIRANPIALPLYFVVFTGFAFFFLALNGITFDDVWLAALIGATLAFLYNVGLAKGWWARQADDAHGD